jgi:hypothetical protein
MSMNEGSEHASAAPEKARRTASSVKFRAQAWSMRKTPHMKILIPRYLPMGKRCIIKLVGTTYIHVSMRDQIEDGMVYSMATFCVGISLSEITWDNQTQKNMTGQESCSSTILVAIKRSTSLKGKGWTKLTSPSQKPKIENTTQPTILRPLQLQILPNSKNCRITQSCLINIKEGITNSQVRQNHKIDFTLEGSFVGRGDGFVEGGGIGEEGQGRVAGGIGGVR